MISARDLRRHCGEGGKRSIDRVPADPSLVVEAHLRLDLFRIVQGRNRDGNDTWHTLWMARDPAAALGTEGTRRHHAGVTSGLEGLQCASDLDRRVVESRE